MVDRKIGVLVANLGTPDAPETSAVRRYLAEFLMDGRVIDMNPIGRALLVYGIIAPSRSPRSARAYQKVWTERGSPLLVHGQDLVAGLKTELGEGYEVVLGMRYGRPSLRGAWEQLRDAAVERVILLPLFPQYASSTTGSLVEALYKIASESVRIPAITVIEPFYNQPAYLDAMEASIRPELEAFQPDMVLFSYHGLPVRHITAACDHPDCLQTPGDVAHHSCCYWSQCYASSALLTERLGLANAQTSFQSRLGRTPWIQPYTDETVQALAKTHRRLAVLCPAFAADCLESLEEIAMEAAEAFVEAGGEALKLIPALNAHPAWVKGAAQLIRAR